MKRVLRKMHRLLGRFIARVLLGPALASCLDDPEGMQPRYDETDAEYRERVAAMVKP